MQNLGSITNREVIDKSPRRDIMLKAYHRVDWEYVKCRGKYLRRCASGKQIDVYPVEKRRFLGWKASRTSVYICAAYESLKHLWFFTEKVVLYPLRVDSSKTTAANVPDAYLNVRWEFSTDHIFCVLLLLRSIVFIFQQYFLFRERA